MIKVLIQLPGELISPTPFEVLVSAVPKEGDSFRARDGELYRVCDICFRQGEGQVCSIIVSLGRYEICSGGALRRVRPAKRKRT
jgi:hypothetical protein